MYRSIVNGRIEGAEKMANFSLIPKDTEKLIDQQNNNMDDDAV